MPATPPPVEPTTLIAGDTLLFSRTFTGFDSAAGAILAYHFTGPSVLAWDPAWGAVAGTGWLITIPAASTEGLQPGTYRWFARITDSGVTKTVASGVLTVSANPEFAAATKYQYWEEEALDMIRARLRGDLSHGVMNYMLYGRSVSRYSLEALTRYERELEQRLQQKLNVNRGGSRVERIPFAFRRPT